MRKTTAALIAAASIATALTACSTDADVVSENISKEAEQFGVARRVVFINNITGDYLLEIKGRCNIDVDEAEDQLEVTCKAAGGEYKKHFLGLNHTTTYVVEQVESSAVSADHYKVIFKPEAIIPDVDRP